MKLSLKKDIDDLKPAEVCVIFASEEQMKNPFNTAPQSVRDASSHIELELVQSKPGSCSLLPFKNAPGVILCGLGKEKDITAESLRNTGGSVTSFCRSRSIENLHCLIPSFRDMAETNCLRHIIEGMSLSNYQFNRYKTDKSKDDKLIKNCYLYTRAPQASQIISEIQVIAENSRLCRDLINDTTFNSSPVAIASMAKKLASIKNVTCRVLGQKEISALKMGLLMAVNSGSSIPPQMVILSYRGEPGSRESIALVGKGITFDSGGMNLKTNGHIELMRMDMAGAATVMYALKTAAELGIRKNIHAVMPLTENMISNTAYRPGDVFTAYNGMTVEVGNTDAEGRLILADALAYTLSKLKPAHIIDIATLTGACVVTFGETVAGLISTDDALTGRIRKAADSTGEKIWPLPLYSEYEENMKSDIADLCNMSSEKNSGTIHGAAFLKNFVGETPWAHIDIAGTAWYTKQRGYRPKNATAYGLRLITDLLKNWDSYNEK